MSNDVVSEVARAAPPVVATGLTIFGVSLNDILVMVTIVYTIAQAHFLFREKSVIYGKVYRATINFLLRRKDDQGSKE